MGEGEYFAAKSSLWALPSADGMEEVEKKKKCAVVKAWTQTGMPQSGKGTDTDQSGSFDLNVKRTWTFC